MKLDRFTSARLRSSASSHASGRASCLVTSAILAALVVTAAFASGCNATTAQAPQTASVADVAVAGTTSLMSAELAAPAPRVGKSHLAVDDAADSTVDTTNSDESAPKEARRSDGSHRGGSFGMSSK
jgi:hypothetical protein